MIKNNKNNRNILAIVPIEIAGGGLITLSDLIVLSKITDIFKVYIFLLHRPLSKPKGLPYKMFYAPTPTVRRYFDLLGYNPIFALLYKWYLPFVLPIILLVIRPSIIIIQGISTLFLTFPILKIAKKILGTKIVIMHRHYTGLNINYKLILGRLFNSLIDLAFVNSIETGRDLLGIIDKDKITIIGLWAPLQYLKIKPEVVVKLRNVMRQKMNLTNKFVIGFVGRLEKEKMIDILLSTFIKYYRSKDDNVFIVIGPGNYSVIARKLSEKYHNFLYIGYVPREQLIKWYSIFDLIISCADESYITRPGLEALSMGVPIIIFDVPCILSKIERGEYKVRIKTNIPLITISATNPLSLYKTIEYMRKTLAKYTKRELIAMGRQYLIDNNYDPLQWGKIFKNMLLMLDNT